jgi:hypothetical protein
MTLPPPSNKTAFWAGVWTGVVTLVYLVFSPSFESVESSNNAFLAVAVIGLLPTFPFVFGLKRKAYEGTIGARARGSLAEFGATIKRGLIWMVGAAVVHLPMSLLNAFGILKDFPI